MLTSISPLGERARGNRWSLTVLWLTFGSACGGAVVGTVAGVFGQAVLMSVGHNIRLATLVLACAAAAAWDLSSQRFPGLRQVDEDWLVAYRRWVYAAGFGLQLGAAVLTVVNTALVPLFLLAALLAGDIWAGGLIGAVFGVVRGVSLLAVRGIRNPDDLRGLHRRLDQQADRARLAGAFMAAALAAAATATLLAS